MVNHKLEAAIEKESLDPTSWYFTPAPDQTPREKRFRALAKLAPDLVDLLPRSFDPARPPSSLSDAMFVALCMCFADPRKREILRALILDLMADDLNEVILSYLTEETK